MLESTTYPGTTEELVLPILEKAGLRCPIVSPDDGKHGHGFLSRLFTRTRRSRQQTIRPRANPQSRRRNQSPSGRAAAALYAQIVSKVVPVSSTRAAEMVKLLENIFRCVNIALVNELKQLCLRMDLDIWEMIDSAATKPFGFMPFYPGPGLGGHCIPVDPYYLSWKAREYDFATRFIELAGEINTAMPYHVVDAVTAALNEHQKSVKGSKILLLGVAYKKDVDDLRESPSLKLLELLTARGANLDYNDPTSPPPQDAPLRFFAHDVGRTDAGTSRQLRLRPDRHRSLQLRLRCHRPSLQARSRHAQCHAQCPTTRRKSRPLLTRRQPRPSRYASRFRRGDIACTFACTYGQRTPFARASNRKSPIGR